MDIDVAFRERVDRALTRAHATAAGLAAKVQQPDEIGSGDVHEALHELSTIIHELADALSVPLEFKAERAELVFRWIDDRHDPALVFITAEGDTYPGTFNVRSEGDGE